MLLGISYLNPGKFDRFFGLFDITVGFRLW